jgi:hypothetical protein
MRALTFAEPPLKAIAPQDAEISPERLRPEGKRHMIGGGTPRPGSKGGHDVGRMIRTVVALLGGAAILVAAAWLDTDVLRGIQQRAAATFDITVMAWALPLGYLAIAGGILALGLLARWARSLLVGLAYLVVGAFFAFLGTLVWTVAAQVNDAPSVLPEPIAVFVSQVYRQAESGPLHTVAIIGAGMLLIGLATIGLARRSRAPAAQSEAKGPTKAQASSRQEPVIEPTETSTPVIPVEPSDTP